jgi:hypothetical protein
LRFSRVTGSLRRKDYGSVVISYIAANSIAAVFVTSLSFGCNLRLEGLQRKIQMPASTGEPAPHCPATIPRDENLKANSRRRRKTKRGTEATTRSILELSAAAITSPVVSSLIWRQAEWPAQRIAVLQKAASAEQPDERSERQPEKKNNASIQGG